MRNVKDEVCFGCTIIDWTVHAVNEFSTLISVIGTDSSRVLLVMRFTIPSILVSKIHWLTKDHRIRVYYALIDCYDYKLDVLNCCAGDHTFFKVEEKQHNGDLHFSNTICECERRRFKAIQSGKDFYLQIPTFIAESSARYSMRWAIVQLITRESNEWTIRILGVVPCADFRVDPHLLPDNVKHSNLPWICDLIYAHRFTADRASNVFIERYVVYIEFAEISAALLGSSLDTTF